ncbi:calmodulin [Acrasis kona]|uniref:Calmodulin n=1 Tax=Acrasis kona TaxID=1008807 RepID=A0AAW2Z1W1_9EUKA
MSKHSLTEEQVSIAREKFNLHDKDKSNDIDISELKSVLEATTNSKISEGIFNRYVTQQLSTFDKNNDNKINFEEFLVLYDKIFQSGALPIAPKQGSVSTSSQVTSSTSTVKVVGQADKLTDTQRQEAKLAFDKHDVDKSGTISRNELKKVLEENLKGKKMGNLVFDRLVSGYMQQADKDQSGEITFEEFLSIYAAVFNQ